mmetsp:Transcript_8543/g.12750  ORF Transcript_8543/g.12750 Transcript_8543/m.12750 type:complete len:126 (+) Transcript_8543:146-523(+)|eukprot:CAMPEP_0185034532 /NCGR_PEP_ID=MMETSP1103-20130426/24505_1 /TAXON_ID=36769 /ORGANISM="Paraphysomonas bandaiensis, Strain Caron Lab Isolate" /LENGTH=125 /DNA_ID=CAMNT_0027571227 /DNA_START=77 /DNA_END=454 /DNA_ORIENTATION=-
MNLSSRELDVLLHLELQKSEKLKEDIESELNNIRTTVESYEMFKAHTSNSTSSVLFSDYLQGKQDIEYNDKKDGRNDRSADQRKQTHIRKLDQGTSHAPATVTPSVISMSTLLNRLQGCDVDESD